MSPEKPNPERILTSEMETSLKKLDEQYGEEKGFRLLDVWRYRETVRQKYQLPECTNMWKDPMEYISKIKQFCSSAGIDLRYKHEFEEFFHENPSAGAVSLRGDVFRDTTVIVSGTAEDDWFGLRRQAQQMSHEVVHALQYIRHPRMPHEEAEREAYYYQMFTPERITNSLNGINPKDLYDYVSSTIENSVKNSVSVDEVLDKGRMADASKSSPAG